MKTTLVMVAGLVAFGCSGGGSEVAPAKDKQLRNNFDRALTPEEVAQMGKAQGAQAPTKGK